MLTTYVLISNDYRALRSHVDPSLCSLFLVPPLARGTCCIAEVVMRCCSCCLREVAAKRSTTTDGTLHIYALHNYVTHITLVMFITVDCSIKLPALEELHFQVHVCSHSFEYSHCLLFS